MDKITREIRLSHWKAIIKQCSLRPSGQTVNNGWLITESMRKLIITGGGCDCQ